ncbi:MAG: hypothetical protein JWN01_735 [Patescibacteria group bacterium]|nr:hypothetical protein [Patescibacteria group bacterium]
MHHMQRAKVTVWGVVGTLIAVMALSFILPTPQGNDWLTFHAYFAVAIGTAVSFVGASVLFIMGLGGFTSKLKRVYILICIALTFLGIAFLQLPLFLYLVTFSTYWKDNSVSAIPFMIAIIMVYVGTRALAKLFGIHNFTTKIWFEVVGLIIVLTAVVMAPHVPTVTSEFKLDAANGLTIIDVFNMAMGAAFVLQVKRIASVMYANALAWMTVSFIALVIGGAGDILAILSVGDQQWFLIGAFPMIPLFIAGIFMLRAAYSFSTITAGAGDTQGWVARNFFGKPIHPQKQSDLSSVDIVVYAANLASSTQSIDSLLDRLRHVTARMRPGQKLSAADEAILMQVYLDIERYLLEREQVRKFSKESLRQTIAQKLRLTDGAQQTFWPKLV